MTAQRRQVAPPLVRSPADVGMRTRLPQRRGRGLLLHAFGPAFLVAVGYMDPGNWATDIQAGSAFGYDLLFVIAASCVSALMLQWLAMRLGSVTGRDLARLARDRYSPAACGFLWILAEIAIVATDVAEVLGSALAMKLLFGVPLWLGVPLTGLDTLIILALSRSGLGVVKAIVLGLIATVAICCFTGLMLASPSLAGILGGFSPKPELLFGNEHALYLSAGILGATVMPHNLYLHSWLMGMEGGGRYDRTLRARMRQATLGLMVALVIASLVNAAILSLAAARFHAGGHMAVGDIETAYRLIEPLAGASAAASLFAIALLASGQSATFTGTIAGQVVLEGFLNLKIPDWQRRAITRGLALVPAMAGVLWLGEQGVGPLLVSTQVVLSLQLPFAIYPLIRFTSNPEIMGRHANSAPVRLVAWSLLAIVGLINAWLIARWAF